MLRKSFFLPITTNWLLMYYAFCQIKSVDFYYLKCFHRRYFRSLKDIVFSVKTVAHNFLEIWERNADYPGTSNETDALNTQKII